MSNQSALIPKTTKLDKTSEHRVLPPVDEIHLTKSEALVLFLCWPMGCLVERANNHKLHKEIRQMRRSLGLPTNKKELGI